jgi:hypothetical protein
MLCLGAKDEYSNGCIMKSATHVAQNTAYAETLHHMLQNIRHRGIFNERLSVKIYCSFQAPEFLG